MSRSKKRVTTRYQRLFWVLSIIVVLSMAISLVATLTPGVPRVTPTPTFTPVFP